MNSNQIELLAVNAVEDYFTKIKRINPTIPVLKDTHGTCSIF